MDLARDEVEALLAERKVATGNIHWHHDGQRYVMTEVLVLAIESEKTLRLVGKVGKTNRGFTLLYKGMPIRRLSIHPKHRNPDGTLIRGPHKHIWDEIFEDRSAYVPVDISFGDPIEELQGFLAECNIEFNGAIQSIGLDAKS